MQTHRRNAVTVAMAILFFLLPRCGLAADIPVNPTGQTFSLPTLLWGNTTSSGLGFNNNFFFAPLYNNESVCVYVYNNNTTNLHAFNAAIAVSANPAEVSPSDGTWQNAAVTGSSSLVAPAAPGFAAGIGAQVSGSALVSVNLSGSATAAGSPDTASVKIIQTTGACFGGNSFISSSLAPIYASRPIQSVSDGLSQAYFATFAITNPTAGELLLAINGGVAGTKTLYFDRVTLTSTVATTFQIGGTSNAGTTCGSGSTVSLKIGTVSSSTTTVQTGPCTTNPSGITTGQVANVPANGTQIVDLTGYIAPPFSTTGMGVTIQSAVTGTVVGTIFWYEK